MSCKYFCVTVGDYKITVHSLLWWCSSGPHATGWESEHGLFLTNNMFYQPLCLGKRIWNLPFLRGKKMYSSRGSKLLTSLPELWLSVYPLSPDFYSGSSGRRIQPINRFLERTSSKQPNQTKESPEPVTVVPAKTIMNMSIGLWAPFGTDFCFMYLLVQYQSLEQYPFKGAQ